VDFAETILSDLVVTDRVVETLNASKLTGFETRQAIINTHPRNWQASQVPRLWELVITGHAGFAASESNIFAKEKCATCGWIQYSAFENGIYVNENTYDGSDFCVITEYPKHILVSESSKRLIEGNGFTNANFTDSKKIRWPIGVARP